MGNYTWKMIKRESTRIDVVVRRVVDSSDSRGVVHLDRFAKVFLEVDQALGMFPHILKNNPSILHMLADSASSINLGLEHLKRD